MARGVDGVPHRSGNHDVLHNVRTADLPEAAENLASHPTDTQVRNAVEEDNSVESFTVFQPAYARMLVVRLSRDEYVLLTSL